MTVLFSRTFLRKALTVFLVAFALQATTGQLLLAQSLKTHARVFPGEYIVSFPSPDTGVRAVRPHNGEVVKRIARGLFLLDTTKSARGGARGLDRVSVPVDPRDTTCKELLARGDVVSCSPNYEVRIDNTTPNDPMLSSLWGLRNENGMAAQRAWEVSTGSADVVVAVIDTGIDYTHPDLSANIWTNTGEIPGNGVDDDTNGYVDDVHGINAAIDAGTPGDPMDDNGHGTHVAGTIGAVGDNGLGLVGINHRVKIIGLKFLGASGAGSLSDAIRAIDYMIELKNRGVNIRIANNSWGGSGYAAALGEVLERAEDAGILFVAAAGNEGADNDVEPSYPANFEFENVVSVAAVDEAGNLASFSNYGPTTVDIAAPGVGIYSTYPGNRYARLSGTSMAAPHVVGALALLFAAEPQLTPAEALTRLYDSGRERGSLYDGGRREALVRTQRSVDVGRMLFKEISPLAEEGVTGPACVYDLHASNLAFGGRVDTAADRAPIVQQSDEGDFYRLDLPFAFPFYSTTVSTLYVSPNGVVYLNPPTEIDFEAGRQAPMQSIAALHIDMVPLSSRHGVRVFKGSDKVTISWEQGLFATQKIDGVVRVRLTLHASGEVENSVSFEGGEEARGVQRLAFGDPFQLPASRPAALIGISGASTMFASTLDISESLRGLVSSLDQRLVLGVSMKPRCKDVGVRTRVTSVSLKKMPSRRSSNATEVRGTLAGEGSGNVPVSIAVDSFQCLDTKQIRLEDGQVTFRAKIPRGPVRLEASSGSARGRVRLASYQSSRGSPKDRRVRARVCKAIVRSIRPVSQG